MDNELNETDLNLHFDGRSHPAPKRENGPGAVTGVEAGTDIGSGAETDTVAGSAVGETDWGAGDCRCWGRTLTLLARLPVRVTRLSKLPPNSTPPSPPSGSPAVKLKIALF